MDDIESRVVGNVVLVFKHQGQSSFYYQAVVICGKEHGDGCKKNNVGDSTGGEGHGVREGGGYGVEV